VSEANDLEDKHFFMTVDVHYEGDRLFGDESSGRGGSIGQEDWNGGCEGACWNLVLNLKACVHQCKLRTPRIIKERRLPGKKTRLGPTTGKKKTVRQI
jgi:hypothetical protein